jgi:predicted nucleotidyltransferase
MPRALSGVKQAAAGSDAKVDWRLRMDYRNDMALSDTERHRIIELAETINRRNRTERTITEKRLRDRVSAARAEVDRLVLSFGEVDAQLRQVVLFGSLARGDAKRLEFDIDLAVESSRFTDLLGIAMDSEFKVDLVDLACASPYILKSVDREGVVVFRAE